MRMQSESGVKDEQRVDKAKTNLNTALSAKTPILRFLTLQLGNISVIGISDTFLLSKTHNYLYVFRETGIKRNKE